MSIRTLKSTYDDQQHRKRPASEILIEDRLYKCAKKANSVDSVFTSPLRRHIDLSSKYFRTRCQQPKSSLIDNRDRNRERDLADPGTSQQRDNDLLDGGEKLLQTLDRGHETKVPSINPDPCNVIVAPLTRQALDRLNRINHTPYSEESSSMSDIRSELVQSNAPEEPKGAINAYSPNYLVALEERSIFFSDDEPEQYPSNLVELTKAIFASRTDPDPDDAAARTLRILMRSAPNESATVQSILPKLVPIEELVLDTKTSTAPDQRWHCKIMIKPDGKPALTAPKPDMTIGWFRRVFNRYPQAMRYLAARACPVASNPEVAIPLFTIEVKGDRGNLKAARLQNLHNGATMLSNLWHIRQFCRTEDEGDFFNKVHAMSLELTAEIVQLSCYWANRDENGMISYYGMALHTWTPYVGSQYKEARRCTRNALEWVRAQAFGWICSTMADLEADFCLTGPTPPRTSSDKSSAKRSGSMTSGSTSANSRSKKLKSTKMQEVLCEGGEVESKIEAREGIMATGIGVCSLGK